MHPLILTRILNLYLVQPNAKFSSFLLHCFSPFLLGNNHFKFILFYHTYYLWKERTFFCFLPKQSPLVEVWVSNELEKIKIGGKQTRWKAVVKEQNAEGMAVALTVEMVREEYIWGIFMKQNPQDWTHDGNNLERWYAAAAAAAKLLQSYPTLCDPIDGSPPGSPIPGILQARTLEWVAISFSNACKWKVKVKSLSRAQLLAAPRTAAYQAPLSMDFPGKSTGVGCHCLLR